MSVALDPRRLTVVPAKALRPGDELTRERQVVVRTAPWRGRKRLVTLRTTTGQLVTPLWPEDLSVVIWRPENVEGAAR